MTEGTKASSSFQLRKIGHVVLNVTDLEASVRFYTDVLGLQVSDRYPDSMVPGGMVFMRCNADHHGVALVGGAKKSDRTSLNHFAFGAPTRRLSDRRGVPGPRREQPRDLLGHRPGRHERIRTSGERVATSAHPGGRRRQPAARPAAASEDDHAGLSLGPRREHRALPSLNLIGQSLLAGLFTGGLYALLGLGLSLTWGLLRVINLANFALAFLGAYLTYHLATAFRLDPILTLVVIVPGFFVV